MSPSVAIELSQTAGGPAYEVTGAVSKSGAGAVMHMQLSNSSFTTTTYNVLTYGAAGNGTTDDSLAIRDAYLAARANSANGAHSTVYFPPGRTYYVATPWNLQTIRTNDWVGQTAPTYQQRGIVRFSGYGATIKYTSANTRFCWLQGPNPTALYSTYGNLEIMGFTLDPNFRSPSGESGDCIWIQGDGNVDNVTIQDITTLQNKVTRTTNTQIYASHGVALLCSPESRSQEHYGYMTNITIEDSNFFGGSKAIAVYCANQGTATTPGANKYLLDNINIARCTADILHYFGSNIHIGSYGAGYRCSVVDCDCRNSSDDGLEINAFNEVTVSGCTFTGNWNPITFTWFSYPYASSTPTYTVDGCSYYGDCAPYWPVGSAVPSEGVRSPIFVIWTTGSAATLETRDWGHCIVRNCTIDIGDDWDTYYPVFRSQRRLASVTIDNVDITAEGTTVSNDQISITQSSTGGTLPITITDTRWRDASTSAYARLVAGQVYLSGSRTVTTDITGLS